MGDSRDRHQGPCQKLSFLSSLILKGSDPSIATIALFTANGDGLHKGLSSPVAFTNKNRGHEQNQPAY